MPDEVAFARLVREHKDMVFAVALVHARDRSMAEDVSQEVFMKAFRSMDELREPGRVKTWLYSVTRNSAIDAVRRRLRGPSSLDEHPVEPQAPEPEPDPAQDERLSRIKSVIGTLQEDYREILALRYVKGLSYRSSGGEVAAVDRRDVRQGAAARDGPSAGARAARIPRVVADVHGDRGRGRAAGLLGGRGVAREAGSRRQDRAVRIDGAEGDAVLRRGAAGDGRRRVRDEAEVCGEGEDGARDGVRVLFAGAAGGVEAGES